MGRLTTIPSMQNCAQHDLGQNHCALAYLLDFTIDAEKDGVHTVNEKEEINWTSERRRKIGKWFLLSLSFSPSNSFLPRLWPIPFLSLLHMTRRFG